MGRLYRLPNSGTTESRDEYVKSWKCFAKPLCEAFGWKLRGFNPAFQFETTDERLITLDVSVVIDMRAGLRTLQAHIACLRETNRFNWLAYKALKEMHAHARKP